MLYAPSRAIWTPPGPELLPWLTPAEWERGTRPWHKSDTWRPGRQWCPSPDTARQMHALGIVFPGPASMRRDLLSGSGATPFGPSASPSQYYQLEEASGTRVDTGTTPHDLSPTSTPGNAAGILGNGLSMDGTAKYVSGTAFNLGSGVSFTFALWGKPASFNASERAWGSTINAGFSQGWFLGDNGSGTKHPRLYAKPSGQTLKTVDDTGITFSAGTWYWLLIRFSTSDNVARIRTNDSSEATVNCSSFIVDSTALFLGNGQESVFFDGVLDEAAYFNSSLSSGDVTTLYNAGAGLTWYSGAWHVS